VLLFVGNHTRFGPYDLPMLVNCITYRATNTVYSIQNTVYRKAGKHPLKNWPHSRSLSRLLLR